MSNESKNQDPGMPEPGMAGKGTTNQDWWPNQLNLKILHQNAPESNPLGEVF